MKATTVAKEMKKKGITSPEPKTDRKIQYFHFRRKNKDGILNNGGVTVCLKPYGSAWKMGFSICSPRDTFSKAIGRRISLARAGAQSYVIYPRDFGPNKDDFSKWIKNQGKCIWNTAKRNAKDKSLWKGPTPKLPMRKK